MQGLCFFHELLVLEKSVLMEGVTVFEEHTNWRFNPDGFISVGLFWTCLSIHALTLTFLVSLCAWRVVVIG